MLKEQTLFIVTILVNFVIASIKLISGLMFGFSSLIADSLQSFSDFITDIIAMFANKVGKRRANKKYPFGYGMIENLSNLLIGILMILLAIFIFVRSFQVQYVEVTPIIFVILGISAILKGIVITVLYYYGKKKKNQAFLVSAKESFTDFISTIIVLIVSILLLFEENFPLLKYSDMVGSILISLIIWAMAIKIIVENVVYLLGSSEENQEILTKIEEILQKHKIILGSKIQLMKVGNYYNLYLTIELDDTISLKKLFQLDNQLKKEIKRAHLKIRFIEIEPKKYH